MSLLKNKWLIIFRFIIGTVLLVSGIEKLMSHYQNFLYVVQAYEIFNHTFDMAIVRVVPWIELFFGIFLILGLWTRLSLYVSAALFLGFICVVGQALLRKLPIDECGCFGDLITFPPQFVIGFDTVILIILIILIKNVPSTSFFSLDSYFNQQSKS